MDINLTMFNKLKVPYYLSIRMFTLIRPGVRGPPQLLRVRVSQTGKETLGRKTNHGFLLGLFYKDYSNSMDGQEEND